MTRHEDSPWEGLAETAGTVKDDYDTLEKLHIRLTRPAHYLRDRDGSVLASGEQPIPDLQQAALVRGTWAAGASLPLHLPITFLDAKGDAEGATALDAYPLNFSGQRVEDMKQTPH